MSSITIRLKSYLKLEMGSSLKIWPISLDQPFKLQTHLASPADFQGDYGGTRSLKKVMQLNLITAFTKPNLCYPLGGVFTKPL